jgi:predicted metal-dependent hydrolase
MTARSITTRRIAFEYPAGSIPQHFAGGDLVMSHVVAMLSAMFPNGEDFFVESVRRYRDRIEDPE